MTLLRYKQPEALKVPPEVLCADDLGVAVRLHHVHPTEIASPPIELASLDDVIRECLELFTPFDTAMDQWLTPRLHKALPLTRRQGADQQLWAWLGLAKYPDLVTHRWKKKADTGAWPSERIVGSKVRQTFARLWWAAELTVKDPDDYSLTLELLGLGGFQDVYEAIFGREFCGYQPAVAAFIRVVAPRPQGVVRETAKEFSNLLSTSVLERMSESELKQSLHELAERVTERYES